MTTATGSADPAGGGVAPFDPGLDHLLHRWLPRQRWYPAKGRGVSLHRVGGFSWPDPGGQAEIHVHLVGLDSGDRIDVVQVPLTYRSAPLEGGEHALVGRAQLADLGDRWVYDGPHDPAYVAALLRSLQSAPGARRPDPGAPAKVLTGEQSNTSVIVGAGTADACIVKVFRPLHAGANPDVEVTAALAAVGCDRIAEPLGWVPGSWTSAAGAQLEGHLAVASEFLAGSQDAWREAVVSVERDADFTSQAKALGQATASVHVALVEAFGTTPTTQDVRRQIVEGLRGRVEWALASAPALQPHASALRAHATALGDLADLPELQRVHGDYHLGQVLHSPERGWVLLDFEGEPLRPLAERVLPDLALRDVAGMLRSFDYAARYSGRDGGDGDSEARDGNDVPEGGGGDHDARGQRWATACVEAFCAGYATVSGEDPRSRGALLAALELDKALYEVVYETRNRPDWLDVPLRAVERLVEQPA